MKVRSEHFHKRATSLSLGLNPTTSPDATLAAEGLWLACGRGTDASNVCGLSCTVSYRYFLAKQNLWCSEMVSEVWFG